jgi:hypothetical protein
MPLTTDPSRPAQLLSPLSSYPNPALWGFPLDKDQIMAGFKKLDKPSSPDSDSDDDDDSHFFRYCSKYFWDLGNQFSDIWVSKTRAGVRQVRSKGKPQLIIAIVKCTHADDRLLPPAEKIEEMRKLVVALGFKGEPGWFIKR